MVMAAEIRSVWRSCGQGFLMAGLFSFLVNLLYLTPTIYMIQVFDRVVSSGSFPTLISLLVITIVCLLVMALLDEIRSRILVRLSVRIDRSLSKTLVAAQVAFQQRFPNQHNTQLLRELDNVRQFITSNGIHAFFDIPWIPIFLSVLYLLNPTLFFVSLAGVIISLLLTIATEWLTSSRLRSANFKASRNYAMTDTILVNTDVIQSMGMLPQLLNRWGKDRESMLLDQVEASNWSGVLNAITKWFRMTLQAVVLAVAAWETVQMHMTGGEMFAATIILNKAISPIEQIMGVWAQFVTVRGSFKNINEMFLQFPAVRQVTNLPKPDGNIEVSGLVFSVPTQQKADMRPLFQGLSFSIGAGECVGLIGPSGAGKTTLARLLTGIWRPQYGTVRIDGAEIHTWDRNNFGRYVGYLPQDIELFNGTVRDNIARFANVSDEEVIRTAKLSGVHELILQLPNGYDTVIGEGGKNLSAGQRQRIGIARTMFGDPSVLILDEPNSNLDSFGEDALFNTIREAKIRKASIILITHRPGILALADKIMVLQEGMIELYGPKEEVLARLGQPTLIASGSETASLVHNVLDHMSKPPTIVETVGISSTALNEQIVTQEEDSATLPGEKSFLSLRSQITHPALAPTQSGAPSGE